MENEWVEYKGVTYEVSAEWDEFEAGWIVTRCVNIDIDPDDGEGDGTVEDVDLQEYLLEKAVEKYERRESSPWGV